MRLVKLSLFAVLAACSLTAPAFAEIETFNVNGLLQSGQTFAGSFMLDTSKSIFDQYSDIDILVNGDSSPFDSVMSLTSTGSTTDNFQIGFIKSANCCSDELGLTFTASTLPSDPFTVTSIDGRALGSDSFLSSGGGTTMLVSGNITNAAPEPATWAMMILGLGLVGGMMYRHRRHDVMTRIAFAA